MLRRARLTFAALALALVATVALAPAAASADTSDFTFDLFDADYTLSQAADGTSQLDVVETIVAEFPDYDQNRGIIRALPQYYQRVALETEVTSIVDEDGDDVYYEVSDTGDYLELALGTDDFVYGENTYVISYTQHNVVGTFADTDDDEFYWDVNGTGWDQPFGTVSATLHVDPSLVASLTGDNACYRGVSGTQNVCDIGESTDDATGERVFVATSDSFQPRENMTLVVSFTVGTFVQGEKTQPIPVPPTLSAPLWSYLIAGLVALGGIAALVFAIVARARRGDGARGRGIIVPQYSVPDGLNVMVAAQLVRKQATAVPAQLVSLAVRKNLRILDYPVTTSGAEYTLQFLSTDGADELELELLHALFGPELVPGEVKELAPDNIELGKRVAALTAKTTAAIHSTGLRAPWRPGGWQPVVVLVALGIVGIVDVVATLAVNSISPWPIVAVVVVAIAFVVSLFLVQRRGLLTEKGAEARDYLLGMQVYLKLAEQERFRMLQSPDGAERVDVGDTKQVIKVYEKLLPFAIIWGVEDEWSKELEIKILDEGEQPDWFTSTRGFSAVGFTSAIGGISSASTYTPTSSSWTSGSGGGSSFGSSFGGSGGGGFSGGGGGGGGGGGR